MPSAPLIKFEEEKEEPTWKNDKRKGKQTEELIWNLDQAWRTDNNQNKLLTTCACCGNDEEYQMATKFYYCTCLVEHFGRPKQVGKWNNTLCLTCGKTLPDKEIWNNISG
ncbi:hypothetical protein G9A89_021057 [Geosiphon pyriformis]|nr:hypothetical protein G9A89_021057 [Geosiphon pyriformis]